MISMIEQMERAGASSARSKKRGGFGTATRTHPKVIAMYVSVLSREWQSTKQVAAKLRRTPQNVYQRLKENRDLAALVEATIEVGEKGGRRRMWRLKSSQ